MYTSYADPTHTDLYHVHTVAVDVWNFKTEIVTTGGQEPGRAAEAMIGILGWCGFRENIPALQKDSYDTSFNIQEIEDKY